MASLAPDIAPERAPSPERLDAQQRVPQLLPLDTVTVQPGFNPRKFFNPERDRQFVEAVRRDGCIFHNIVVRPQPHAPGRYWVVAGERRWRAANEIGLPFIPALVLALSDDDALALAISENQGREDITPGEEALTAQRMIHLAQGDRDEAARRLDWSPRKLEARLLLCQASEAVLMALAEGKIKLGHAELLSSLPEATQNGTLTNVIERQPSVEELRAKLDAFALDLATACFDKAGCRSCPHNTTRQASLFEQHIGEGRCTNRPCFHQRTVQQLEAQRVGLRDEYNAVFIDTERPPPSWKLLLRREVGAQQFNEGCKQCAHFGGLLSSRPGEAGQLTTDVCFNLTCHQEKVTAYQATVDASTPQGESSDAVVSPARAQTDTKAAAPKRKASSTAAAMPKRVQALIDDAHRRAAAVEVHRNTKMVQVYAVLALLRELGLMHHVGDSNDPLNRRGIKRKRSDPRTNLIGALYALEPSALTELTAELAGRLAGRSASQSAHPSESYLKGAQASLTALSVDLAPHFCVDATFLEAHTKAGIESLLTEAGFVSHYNTQKHDANAFKKLMNLKHGDIVAAVMKAGFNFKGFVPRALQVTVT